MENYKKIIIGVIVLILVFLAGKYSSPPKTEIKTVEIIKTVEVEKKQNNISVKIKERKEVDGTITKETEIIDLSHFEKSKENTTQKETQKIITNKPSYMIGLGYGLNSQLQAQYSAEALVRVVSLPVLVGGQITGNASEQTALLKVLIEF